MDPNRMLEKKLILEKWHEGCSRLVIMKTCLNKRHQHSWRTLADSYSWRSRWYCCRPVPSRTHLGSQRTRPHLPHSALRSSRPHTHSPTRGHSPHHGRCMSRSSCSQGRRSVWCTLCTCVCLHLVCSPCGKSTWSLHLYSHRSGNSDPAGIHQCHCSWLGWRPVGNPSSKSTEWQCCLCWGQCWGYSLVNTQHRHRLLTMLCSGGSLSHPQPGCSHPDTDSGKSHPCSDTTACTGRSSPHTRWHHGTCDHRCPGGSQGHTHRCNFHPCSCNAGCSHWGCRCCIHRCQHRRRSGDGSHLDSQCSCSPLHCPPVPQPLGLCTSAHADKDCLYMRQVRSHSFARCRPAHIGTQQIQNSDPVVTLWPGWGHISRDHCNHCTIWLWSPSLGTPPPWSPLHTHWKMYILYSMIHYINRNHEQQGIRLHKIHT